MDPKHSIIKRTALYMVECNRVSVGDRVQKCCYMNSLCKIFILTVEALLIWKSTPSSPKLTLYIHFQWMKIYISFLEFWQNNAKVWVLMMECKSIIIIVCFVFVDLAFLHWVCGCLGFFGAKLWVLVILSAKVYFINRVKILIVSTSDQK